MKCATCKRSDVTLIQFDPRNPPELRSLCSNCLLDAVMGGALLLSQDEDHQQDADMIMYSTLCKEQLTGPNCDRHNKDPENEPRTAVFPQLKGYRGGSVLQACKECLFFIAVRGAIEIHVSPTYKKPETAASGSAALREDGSVSMGGTEFIW